VDSRESFSIHFIPRKGQHGCDRLGRLPASQPLADRRRRPFPVADFAAVAVCDTALKNVSVPGRHGPFVRITRRLFEIVTPDVLPDV
jgi:hypothetical protein